MVKWVVRRIDPIICKEQPGGVGHGDEVLPARQAGETSVVLLALLEEAFAMRFEDVMQGAASTTSGLGDVATPYL
jgi:hypothetical protein